MKESQTEIRAIQAKLQALQMGRGTLRSPTPAIEPPMSESRSREATAAATVHRLAEINRPSENRPSEMSAPTASASSEALPQRTAYSQLWQNPLPLPTLPAPNFMEALQRLEMQAERVNQLSLDQEAALLELKAIAEQVERDRQLLETEGFEDAEPTWEYLSAAVPLVERDEAGTFVVTARALDLFKAEREAASIAQSLRQRSVAAPRHRVRHTLARHKRSAPLPVEKSEGLREMIWEKMAALISSSQSRRQAARLHRQQSVPAPTMTVQDAALWIIGAVVVRRGLDLILAAVPHLWIPIVGLIVVPAAIAIYRTTFTPESGFIWGYRLFLVMIGLLIGGRL
jgi:hypothetical protein